MSTSLKKYKGKWGIEEARHLLNRAGFGGALEEMRNIAQTGMDEAVNKMLNPVKFDYPQPEWVGDSALRSYYRRRRQLNEQQRRVVGVINRARNADLQYWWLRRMSVTPNQLQEKMTLFWHDHFATSLQKVRRQGLMLRQNELFRKHALGNFKELTHKVAQDPAMIVYLDNQQNRKGKANENFARELMELFTLGIGNYTEQDIKEAARAFTGWAIREEQFRIIRRLHDDGSKTFMGKKGNFNGDDIINIIFKQDACPGYISRKIVKYFVNENPDPELVDNVTKEVKKKKYDLKPVLQKLFTSEAFYHPGNRNIMIKSPIQLAVETVRKLRMEEPPQRILLSSLRLSGQVPFYPPNVAGWDWGKAWINTATLTARQNMCAGLIEAGEETNSMRMQRRMTNQAKRLTEQVKKAFGENTSITMPGVYPGKPYDLQMIADKSTLQGPEGTVAYFIEYFMANKPENAVKQKLIDELAANGINKQSVTKLLLSLTTLPEYQLA